MPSLRAASDTLSPQSDNTRWMYSHSARASEGTSAVTAGASVWPSSARSTSSASAGLVRDAVAPRLVASTAVGMLPYPVSITTRVLGSRSRSAASSSSPLLPGMRRSITAYSGASVSRARAASASAARVTTKPRASIALPRRTRKGSSSSTTNRVGASRLLMSALQPAAA